MAFDPCDPCACIPGSMDDRSFHQAAIIALCAILTALETSTGEDVNIAAFGGTEVSLGQTTMAESMPVVIASNQSAIPTLLTDGTDTADILDLTNSNPLTVAIVDANGDQIASFGGGTQYTEDVAAAANPIGTALNLIRDDARSGSLTTADGDNLSARGTNNGELYVKHVDSIVITAASLPLPTGAATAANQVTIIGHLDGVEALLTIIDANTSALAGTVAGSELQVDIVGALPAGNNNIGDVDIASIAAGNNNIGDVDIASIAAGNNNIGDVDIASGTLTTVTTVTTVSTLTGSSIAHDAADSGNPHKIGFKAYSPDGTTPGTAVAELDRSDSKCDLDGRLYTNPAHPRSLHKHLNGSTAYTDESIAADPGDGFQIIITSIICSTGAATALNFFLEEGSTTIFGPIYLEAVAGRGFCSGQIRLPITASTAVTLTSSASIAQSFDIDYYIQAV